MINGRRFYTAAFAVAFEWLVLSKLNWSLFIHPVSAFAHIIGRLLEAERKRVTFCGAFLNCVFVTMGVGLGCGLRCALRNNFLGQAFEALIVASLFAHGCLFVHVGNVLNRVYSAEFDVSKHSLAMIVGRDVSRANECEACAVTVLSLIENFCDGVFSPLFYYLLFGLPGLLTYKVVELADSIYGNYKCENRALGNWVAVFDNVLNYTPSRVLSVLFLIVFFVLSLGGYSVIALFSDVRSVATLNSVLSEACVAFYLGVKLNGDRNYNNVLVRDRQLNAMGRTANGLDVKRAQCAMIIVCLILMIVISCNCFARLV
ncbi:MAG: cobalamin biosynthesis protein [Candidatus Hodgkinia cicadicola]|nr:MAG: cobalamin biosynthesis protein [Candidatus Hodgkinia cicadicola]